MMKNELIKTGIIFALLWGFSILANAQLQLPPGIVAKDTLSKYPADYMGTVDFTSAYRFVTGFYVNTGWFNTQYPPPGWGNKQLNYNPTGGYGKNYTMYGFSIPLVADLDGDGNPEVIGLGIRDDVRDNLGGEINAVQIYNGKTGTLIKRRFFEGTNATWGYQWGNATRNHGSPSLMSIVDSDRDGTKELIMAFPDYYGADSLHNRLVSYNLTPIKSGNVTIDYDIKFRWKSAIRYSYDSSTNNDRNAYEKPIPTIVDFDGDGVPEILAYNKIFNAIDGTLKLELESLQPMTGNNTYSKKAFVGCDSLARVGDQYLGFNYVYDMDGDHIYDVIAGGKIYKITKNPTTGFLQYDVIHVKDDNGKYLPDGRTGVADINGDGIPDVITVMRANNNPNTNLRVVVWNPNFTNNGQNWAPEIMADVVFRFPSNQHGDGTNSYIYIGDIDGKRQNGHLLPEICLEANEYDYKSLMLHPNLNDPSQTKNNNMPTSGSSNRFGDLIGLTWDADNNVPKNEKLKLSFVLEHRDASHSTGFSMFDFDNDGMQEICYRDAETLRIIKAGIKPYVKLDESDKNIILYKESVKSYTGYEYASIADIDNDGSAEMVVIGNEYGNLTLGYIYALGNGSGDKFAPALPVWNQFMYDPFKIDPDSLVTPIGAKHAINRLDYKFTRIIRDENGHAIDTIKNYNPFNGTLLQAMRINEDSISSSYGYGYEPVVFLTQFYVDTAKAYPPQIVRHPVNQKYYIQLRIGNDSTAKTDVSPNLPFIIYYDNTVSKNKIASRDTLKNALDASTLDTLGTNFTIAPGKTMDVWLRIPDASNFFSGPLNLPAGQDVDDQIYIVRFGDDSKNDASGNWAWKFGYNRAGGTYTGEFGNGTAGQASRAFRDGKWEDQVVRIANPQLFNDYVTLQELSHTEIDVLANDLIPDVSGGITPHYLSNLVLADSNIVKYPAAGYLTFNNVKGAGGRIIYHHADSVPLTHGVDSFVFRLNFDDNGNVTPPVITAHYDTVYIYILRGEASGFSYCAGQTSEIELVENPAGIGFTWLSNKIVNNKNVADLVLENNSRKHVTARPMGGDSIYWIKPLMLNPSGRFFMVDFPFGELHVSVMPYTVGSNPVMRWTGAVSTNWRDPKNWVSILSDNNGNPYEAPVNYIPAPCTNVIISTSVEYYPELKDSAKCSEIYIKDRAQLKNPHVLKYDSAKVEFKLKPAELGRYVMWSAPLKDTYTGDYHFRLDGNGNPMWGDAFMSFFQQANPDKPSSSVTLNRLTASIAKIDHKLELGDAFNLQVKDNTVTRNTLLSFPKKATRYTDANNNPSNTLSRTNAKRFITDGQAATFDIPVKGGDAGNHLILVANPYLAYLDMGAFLGANPDVQSGYYIWNGKNDNGFVTVAQAQDIQGGYRYEFVSTSPALSNPGFIPPLQSFFVAKKNNNVANKIEKLKMSSVWTKTIPPKDGTYNLFRTSLSSSKPQILNISLSQGANDAKSAYAAVLYNSDASAMLDKIDMPVISYSEMPLALYTFAGNGEPLAINNIDKFGLTAYTMKLGLRVRDAGEVKLSFSNMLTFGYNVTLVDRERNNQKIAISEENPNYTFTVAKSSSEEYAEVNDRFILEFTLNDNTGTGTIQDKPIPTLQITSDNGQIEIRSNGDPISVLRIYDVLGKLAYENISVNTNLVHVPVAVRQLYIVRAVVSGEKITEKIMVR
jgi:hypothetical protein